MNVGEVAALAGVTVRTLHHYDRIGLLSPSGRTSSGYRQYGPNDLDRLTNSLLTAWARLGAGKAKEAISMVEKLEGPAWYGIFKRYNAGAMAALAGDIDTARRNLNEAVTDRPIARSRRTRALRAGRRTSGARAGGWASPLSGQNPYASTRPPKNGISARVSGCGRCEVNIISAPA